MVPPNNLCPDLAGKLVNETLYRRMIGLLMYLTAIRLDIQFFTVLCARYQSNPKESHLTAMKRILMYLKGFPSTLDEGTITYPKDLGGNDHPFDRDLTFTTSDKGVWTLVPLLNGKIAISYKWVLKKKKDEHGATIKNKARLVAQGYSQEEGIDYDETFAPVARMEAIGILLAFATYTNFKVYQMDIKSSLLNVKTPMVPPNNLCPDLAGKPVNETLYRRMIRDDMDEDTHADEEVKTPPPKQDQPDPSNVQESTSDSSNTDLKRFDNTLPLTKRQLIKYSWKMSRALKDQPYSAPSGSVTLTFALTDTPANVEGENASTTSTEESPSHIEMETKEPTYDQPISSVQPTNAQPITLIISHPNSSQATQRVDKRKRIATEPVEDPSKKLVHASTIILLNPDEPVREAKLLAMSRPEVIKVVCKEAKKLRIDLREAISTKAGETFKKAQDAKRDVLKREDFKKVKILTKLNRRRAEEYMWIMINRIKHVPITNVKIHPNTKPIVSSVFRNNDKRKFDVHNPLKFTDFGITELDKLCLITQKKNSTAFQRWNDIHKVRMEALVSCLVAASMVKSPKNASFSMKLRKLIIEQPN
nr:retrovirus-related Pol polyprotein from transposon TNT 1-94 [Tanacetum cinerariifolium]